MVCNGKGAQNVKKAGQAQLYEKYAEYIESANVDIDDIDEKIKSIKNRYKDKIEERAVVEDMVNDCQLVDKSFLESYEYSQKVTEDIMKSLHEDKPASGGSNNDDLMALINEFKNNLQTTQKG